MSNYPSFTPSLDHEEVGALISAALDIMAKDRTKELVPITPAFPVYASHLHAATDELLVASELCKTKQEAREWIMKQSAKRRG